MYINSVEYLKTYIDQEYYDARPRLIVWHRKSGTMVYVDLRVYKSPPAYTPRPRYRNWMHRILVRRQFRSWRNANKRRGNYRFDVVMVFRRVVALVVQSSTILLMSKYKENCNDELGDVEVEAEEQE